MDADRIRELCEGHAHLPPLIAAHIARRLPDHVTAAELEPAAWEALHTAAVTHDPGRGRFESWARLRITVAILDELRGMDPQTGEWRARQKVIDAARDELTTPAGAPTAVQVADAAGITPDTLARHEKARIHVGTLDGPNLQTVLRDPTPTAHESVGGDDDLEQWVRAAVIALPDRKRDVIRAVYWQRRPYSDLARAWGVTESRVSQIHTAAVAMIRDALAHHLHDQPGPPVPAVVARRRDAYRAAVLYAITLDRLTP